MSKWKLLIAGHQLENLILVEFGKCFLNIVPEVDASLLESCCIGVLVFKWGEADDVSTACHLVGVLIITDLWLVSCSLGERRTESCRLGAGSFVGGVTRHTWETADFCCLGGHVVHLGDKMGEFWLGEVSESVTIALTASCWATLFICSFCWTTLFVCSFP